MLLVYNVVFKPVWGTASKSNVAIMERSRTTVLRAITNADVYKRQVLEKTSVADYLRIL